MDYHPKRTDANQSEVMNDLRRLGYAVKSLHETGSGVFDLLVSKYRLNFLVEVKDGRKPPSQRRLTEAQKQFNFEWPGMKCVIANHDDLMRFHDSVTAMGNRLRGMELSVAGNREEQYRPSLY